MSSIADALKRAQQERDRLKGEPSDGGESPFAGTGPAAGAASRRPGEAAPARPEERRDEPSLASVVLRKNPAEPAIAGAERPVHNPVATAIRQAPLEAPPAVQQQQRAAETIVEDYTSKRNLNLPAAMVVYHDRSGPVAEQYRRIRDNLMKANARREPQTLVMTSAAPMEGKTVTALNLALSLVEIRANRVLLIDGCLHAPAGRLQATLTNLLHLQAEAGLSELLSSGSGTTGISPTPAAADGSPVSPQKPSDAYLKATPWHNLFVLPAGARSTPAAAAELLRSSALATKLRQLRSSFDWILIDAPSAAVHPDAGLLATPSDGLLMAVALHHTPHEQVQKTIRRLKSMNLPVKSCILTRA